VPLGVLQRNENKVEEMCEIMDKIHDYIPAKHVVESFPLFEDDIEVDEELFHEILLGSDNLLLPDPEVALLLVRTTAQEGSV